MAKQPTPSLDLALTDDFERTLALVQMLRERIEREPLMLGKRGDKANPLGTTLAQQQTHLRGLARLLKSTSADLPRVDDDELAELLG